MTCDLIRSDLLDAATGSCEPAARPAVERHLATCAACRTLAADLRGVADLLRTGPDPHPPASFWDGFMDDLDARLSGAPRGAAGRARAPIFPLPPRRARRLLRAVRRGAALVAAAAAVVVSVVAGGPPAAPAARAPGSEFGALVSEAVVDALPGVGQVAEEWSRGLSALDLDAPGEQGAP